MFVCSCEQIAKDTKKANLKLDELLLKLKKRRRQVLRPHTCARKATNADGEPGTQRAGTYCVRQAR